MFIYLYDSLFHSFIHRCNVVSKDLLFNFFLAYTFAFSLLSKCRTLDLLGQDFLVLGKLIHCLGTIIHASSGLSVSKTVSFYDCPILKILLLGYAKNIIYILYTYQLPLFLIFISTSLFSTELQLMLSVM